MIPAGFIQELLSRVDIVDVVGRHVQLKKTGANLMGLCPFHGEKSPSFSVSPSKQFYYCFGCGASGDALKFLAEHTGASFREAVADLAQQVGLTVPDDERDPQERENAARAKQQQASLSDVLARAADHYRKQLKASPRAIDYLKGRGLTGEIAARFGLGYAPDGWRSLASAFPRYDDPLLVESGLVILHADEGQGGEEKRYDRFRDRVMFPIRSVQGEVIGFGGRVLDRGEPKYLNSPETPVFVKGRELYGLFEARAAIRQRGHALVVEGYMDVVALAQLGIGNAVATLGTACGEEHVRKLFRFTDAIVFSFDGDAAGRRAAARAMESALPHASDTRSLRFLFLPPEHDPDSYVRAHGAEAFERCIADAVPLSKQLIAVAGDGCDLATPEGRARFLAQAKPLWSALPAGALARQMLGEIARQAGLPDAELASQWSASGPRPHPVQADGAPSAPGGERPGRPGGFARGGSSRPAGPRAPRRAPRRPEDRVVQLLLTHADWWDRLSPDHVELLHGLPGAHGVLVGWLERELHEHGPRPWAVMRVAIEADAPSWEAWQATARDDPDDAQAGYEVLQWLLDGLLIDALEVRKEQEAAAAAADPQAMARFMALHRRWSALKASRPKVAEGNAEDGR